MPRHSSAAAASSSASSLDVLWESDDLPALNGALQSLHRGLLRGGSGGASNRHDADDPDDHELTKQIESKSDPLGSFSRPDDAGGDQHSDGSVLLGDPTEVFLAIQAAFLRVTAALPVGPSSQLAETTTTMATDATSLHQQFVRQCLKVVEGLATAVVGPAWHRQWMQERRRQRRKRRQRLHPQQQRESGVHWHRREADIGTVRSLHRSDDVARSLRDIRRGGVTAKGRGGLGVGIPDECDDDDANVVNRRRTVSDGIEEFMRHQWNQAADETLRRKAEASSVSSDGDNDDDADSDHLRRYPPIPELLPAAMIRFASYFSQLMPQQGPVDSVLLRAQVAIVRALAVPGVSPEAEPADDEPSSMARSWRIAGVQREMQSMVRLWLLSMSSASGFADGDEDLRLCALTAYRELLADGGWRPAPPLEGHDSEGEERLDPNCVWCHEVLQGIVAALPDGGGADANSVLEQLNQSTEELDTSEQAIGEAALDCMLYMAKTRLVPPMTVFNVVTAVIPFVHLGGSVHPSLSQSSQNAKRISVVPYPAAAGVLYALLQQETTAETTMDVLLTTMDSAADNATVTSSLTRSAVASTAVDEARRATTIVSTALFGNGTGAMAIGMLRVYYDVFLRMTFQCLSRCLRETSTGIRGANSSKLLSHSPVPDPRGGHEDFAGDLLEGLSRAFLSQCRHVGTAPTSSSFLYLSVIEWDHFITNARTCISPWMAANRGRTQKSAEGLVRSIGTFLDYSTDHEPVPFVEYELQHQLYLWLLQAAIPALSNEQEKSATAVSTVRNWIKFGMFPFRLEEWSDTAACILREAFRKQNSADEESRQYVFDASVHLEAIMGLTKENPEETIDGIDVPPSLLVFTQHMRELHLDFIRTSIVPCLREVFLSSSDDKQDSVSVKGVCPPGMVHDSEPKTTAQFFELTVSLTSLQSAARPKLLQYCVLLAGRLYRSMSGDRELRLLFVGMLQEVVLEKRAYTIAGVPPQIAPVRILATIELARCLEAAFMSLLHAHESVQDLIDSLCKVLDSVTRSRQPASSDASTRIEMEVLGMAALDPLTRLRVAIDGKVAFRAREQQVKCTTDLLLPFFAEATAEYRSAVVETYGSPCIGIEGMICSSSSATRVSFEGIVDSVVGLLQTTFQRQPTLPGALSFADKCVRVHCFDVLRHQFLASIPVRLTSAVARDIFVLSGSQHEDSDVAVAKGLALIRCAENAVVLLTCRRSNDATIFKQDLELLRLVLKLVLDLMGSSISQSRVIARHGVTAILPGLCELDQSIDTKFVDQVLSSVDAFLTIAEGTANSTASPHSVELSILTIMHDLFCMKTNISDGLLIRLLKMTATFMAPCSDSTASFGTQLAAECTVLALDRLTVDGLSAFASDNPPDSLTGNDVVAHLSRHFFLNRIGSMNEGRLRMNAVVSHEELERLSEESMNVERFLACERAAWLLDDHELLTCRVGARMSRYNGFLEVAVRTLAGRRRSLIRIPSSVSVHDPEFPSHLRCPWSTAGQSEWPLGHHNFFRYGSTIECMAAAVTERYDRVMECTCDQPVVEDGDSESVFEEESVLSAAKKSRGNISPPQGSDVMLWLEDVLTLSPADRSFLVDEIKSFLRKALATEYGESEWRRLRRVHFDAQLERVIGVLDRTPSSSAYKAGLLYDQSARRTNAAPVDMETRLLMTHAGSPGYYRFAHRLGTVVQTNFLRYYSGGLDTSHLESDGPTALIWTDSDEAGSTVASRFIVFHAVDMLPESAGPSIKMSRKRHIGNDYVLILFADRGSDAIVEFDLQGGELIGGAFGFVVIWVTLAQPGIFRINVRTRKHPQNVELNNVLSTLASDNAISEVEAPAFVRNIAMRADMACRSFTGAPINAQCNFMYRFHLLCDMGRFTQANVNAF